MGKDVGEDKSRPGRSTWWGQVGRGPLNSGQGDAIVHYNSYMWGVHYSSMSSFFFPQHDKCRLQYSRSSDFFWSCPGKNKSNANADHDNFRNCCLCCQWISGCRGIWGKCSSDTYLALNTTTHVLDAHYIQGQTLVTVIP